MKNKILLIGGGGHCKVIIDAAMNAGIFDIKGIVDKTLAKGTRILSFPVLGPDEMLPNLFNDGIKQAFISIGSVGDCTLRKKLFILAKNIGFFFPKIIHPRSVIAKDVQIGEGTFVAASATINPGTIIGEHAIINTSCSIDHDCTIGNFVHVAPGATLCGSISIKEGSHIGAGSTVIQGTRIGFNCMVRAGRLVKKDVADGEKV